MFKQTLRTLLLTGLLAGTTYVADAQCALSFSYPETNTNVQALQEIQLRFETPEGKSGDGGSFWIFSNRTLSIKDESGAEVTTVFFNQEAGGSYPNYIYTYRGNLDKAITASGLYSLTIPAGWVTSDGDSKDPNEETTITWAVGDAQLPNVSLGCYLANSDPKNNSTVTELDVVKFNFLTPDGNQAYASNQYWDYSARQIEVKDATSAVVKTLPLMQLSGDSDYNFALYFDHFAKPGKYTLTIPAGLMTSVDEQDVDLNNAVTLTYTIAAQSGGDGELTYDFEFDMDTVYPPVGNISWASFQTFETLNISSINASLRLNPASYPYIITPDGDEIEASRVTTAANLGIGNQLIFGFDGSDMWKSGEYTVVIPRNTVGTPEWAESGYSDGSCNEELILNYNYTGNPLYDDDDDDDDGVPFEVEYARLKTSGTTYDLTTSPDKENPTLKLPSIAASSVFTFKTNKNDKCLDAYFTVTDLTTGDVPWLAGTYRQQVTSETDIITINGKNSDNAFEMQTTPRWAVELVEGHTYEIKMEVYKQYDGVPEAQKQSFKRGEANYYIAGTTPGYQYGDAVIESITPNPTTGEITSTDNARFTIKFDKPVEMETTYTKVQGSAGSWIEYEVCESNDGGYTWEFKIPASAVAAAEGELNCRFAPRQDGQALHFEEGSFGIKSLYTSGEKDKTYQTITFNCFLGGASISVDPADGSEVESISKFKFTAPSASHKNIGFQGMSGNGTRLNGILYNSNGEEVARLLTEPADYVNEESGEYNIGVTMYLNNVITTPGRYTLEIPGAFFMTGTESSAKANSPVTFTYTIAGEVEPVKDTCTFTYSIDGHSAVSHEVAKGTRVTVKIAPAENFMIDELSLNGQPQAINGNRYITPELNDDEATLSLTHKYVGDAYFDFSTGVETITGCNYTVVNVEDGIRISGLNGGEDIYVFNAAGMEIANKTNGSYDTVTINLEPGIYIIVVDQTALKVKH